MHFSKCRDPSAFYLFYHTQDLTKEAQEHPRLRKELTEAATAVGGGGWCQQQGAARALGDTIAQALCQDLSCN